MYVIWLSYYLTNYNCYEYFGAFDQITDDNLQSMYDNNKNLHEYYTEINMNFVNV